MMSTLRALPIFLFLMAIKGLSRVFYRFDHGWIGPEMSREQWRNLRAVAILNHTSLFEFLYAGVAPPILLWKLARHGVVPVADKTLRRPLAGRFYRIVAQHVVSISRERDQTWDKVLDKIDDPEAFVAILPEGRMMRANGLDKHGKPMTLRGGIADILKAIPEGMLLLAYSGGLHHVQTPGEKLPRLFKRLRMRFEGIDIEPYREKLRDPVPTGSGRFKKAVIEDLTDRRDRHCWEDPSQRPGFSASVAAAASPSAESEPG